MSTSPLTRRGFLAALGAVAVAPLAVHLAAKQTPTPEPDLKVTTYPLDSKVRYALGHAIKVPSNRQRVEIYTWPDQPRKDPPTRTQFVYSGNWDGTFKLERGCTNPAYILADLYERTGEMPDWVVRPKTWHRMATKPFTIGYGPPLNWPMLYDFGVWCDEVADDWSVISDGPHGHHTEISSGVSARARFTCSAVCQTPAEMVQLRETLRMHCLRWQSTDPRYRTSYPGIPLPEGRA